MTRNYKEESLTSPLSYRILRNIAEADGAAYPSKVAEDLGSTYQTINNYMRGLRKWGVIKKSRKEGKKQYYKIDYSAFNELFVSLWCSNEKDFSKIEELPEKFDSLLQNYIFYYLKYSEESTIEKMIIEDFYVGLPVNVDEKWLKEIIEVFRDIRKNSRSGEMAMRDSIKDI